MSKNNSKNLIFGRIYSFLSRVSNGYVLQASSQPLSEQQQWEEIENIGLKNPEGTKVLIDRALQEKSLSNIDVDIESQEFLDEINKRAFIKNVKQKVAFAVGAVPMFRTLQEISVATALNPQAQIPLNLPLYFGASMPAFVLLHIVEHVLPMGPARVVVKGTKILTGIPFCVTSELVDKLGSGILKTFHLPDTHLNMQCTIGVPSDITLQDVFEDMKRWSELNPEANKKVIKALYKLQHFPID